MPRFPPKASHEIIRLALHGCANRPFYHIVLTNSRRRRDAPPFENLGTYDPMPNIYNEKLVALDVERIKFHLAKDVAMSKPVEKLLGLSGLLPVHPMSYITAQRNRKKAEAEKMNESAETKEDQETDVS